jgi:mannose-6-phosphate isomerase-like protein (cupin superfamily)
MSWFIKNMRDVQWYDAGAFGVYGDFEQGEPFPEFAFNFGVAQPGQPAAMYHREDHQEGFLVVSGECLLIVEGEERTLKQWDYFHCPAGTAHILVGAGDGPAFVIAVGGRVGPTNPVYLVEPVAEKYGASVEQETTDPKEAYASVAKAEPTPFRVEFLPALAPGPAP